MTAEAKYRSRISGVVHEMMADAYEVGVIDKTTMRHFDERCLVEVPDLSPAEILAIREQEGVSQAVFARHLQRYDRPDQPVGAGRTASERAGADADQAQGLAVLTL